jgi:hypothetical protein
MITLQVKPGEYLQIDCSVKVKRISVVDENDQIVVRLTLAAGSKDFCPSVPTWLSVSNGQKTQSFDAQVVGINYETKSAEFVMDIALDKFLFFVVSPIWRNFVRDAIVQFREIAFDPSLRD